MSDRWFDVYIDGTICELDKAVVELLSAPVPAYPPVGIYQEFTTGPVVWKLSVAGVPGVLHPSVSYKNKVHVMIVSKIDDAMYYGVAIVSSMSFLEYTDEDTITSFVLTGDGRLEKLSEDSEKRNSVILVDKEWKQRSGYA